MIRVCAIDGFKTIKAYDYIEDDLLFVYEDYYSSLSKETKQEFDRIYYLFMKIIIHLYQKKIKLFYIFILFFIYYMFF